MITVFNGAIYNVHHKMSEQRSIFKQLAVRFPISDHKVFVNFTETAKKFTKLTILILPARPFKFSNKDEESTHHHQCARFIG